MPGTVAGLALAHEKYGSGKFTLAQLIAPAIRLAREGFDGRRRPRRLAAARAAAARALACVGEDLSQERRHRARRAATGWCRPISRRRSKRSPRSGPRAFYEGPLAEKIVAGVRANGGIMTLDDLKSYRAIERPAVRGTYRGYDIASMPPPSSGGVHLIQILNILEGFPLRELGAGSAATFT